MEYRNNSTGAVESQSEILAKYKNVSFPKPITNDIIEGLGYKTIAEGTRPTCTPPYDNCTRTGIEEISGKWYTKYTKTTATGDAKTEIDNNQARGQRNDRNNLLKDSDWTQVADKAGLSDSKITEWTTYRQALRDLPTASGWPHTHTRPTKPS